MFDALESADNEQEAINILEELIFNRNYRAEAIATSLNLIDDKYDTRYIIDSAAKNSLPTLYTSHSRSGMSMPDVLKAWKGNFREGTEEIYKIATGEVTNESVEKYQQQMRSRLPQKIPLVRGSEQINSNKRRPLRSWSASVSTARAFGKNIQYTVVNPSDVFMCSIYGDLIGEQEYTLTNYTVLSTFRYNTKNHVKLYQKMDSVLN